MGQTLSEPVVEKVRSPPSFLALSQSSGLSGTQAVEEQTCARSLDIDAKGFEPFY